MDGAVNVPKGKDGTTTRCGIYYNIHNDDDDERKIERERARARRNTAADRGRESE